MTASLNFIYKIGIFFPYKDLNLSALPPICISVVPVFSSLTISTQSRLGIMKNIIMRLSVIIRILHIQVIFRHPSRYKSCSSILHLKHEIFIAYLNGVIETELAIKYFSSPVKYLQEQHRDCSASPSAIFPMSDWRSYRPSSLLQALYRLYRTLHIPSASSVSEAVIYDPEMTLPSAFLNIRSGAMP